MYLINNPCPVALFLIPYKLQCQSINPKIEMSLVTINPSLYSPYHQRFLKKLFTGVLIFFYIKIKNTFYLTVSMGLEQAAPLLMQ